VKEKIIELERGHLKLSSQETKGKKFEKRVMKA
jgi:hypothetical protein